MINKHPCVPTLFGSIVLLAMLIGCGSDLEVDSNPTRRNEVTENREVEVDSTQIGATSEAGYVIHMPLTVNNPTMPPPSSTPTVMLTETSVPLPTEITPSATPAPTYPIYNGPPIARDEIGVQIHLHREDLDLLMSHLKTLDVGWVKVQVSWKIYQPEPSRYDDQRFGELDRLIAAASENDIQVLLSVAKAPEWSRPTTELDGPPADFSLFEAFMNLLAARYSSQVGAYELWNESNLRREWNGFPLSAEDLVSLIEAGASGVKAADPGAILISGAPAPTGINDGLSAVDDRAYLKQMVDAGIVNIVDVIGVHPYGWANPADSSVVEPDLSVPSHNDHRSFFFRDTLQDYRAILDQAGHQEVQLWVTEFGWGSFDGLDAQPPDEVAFMAAVDETQQAVYTLQGYEIASQLPGVGPLILWNLNFAPRLGGAFAESGFSLLRTDGSARPVYLSLTSISKIGE